MEVWLFRTRLCVDACTLNYKHARHFPNAIYTSPAQLGVDLQIMKIVHSWKQINLKKTTWLSSNLFIHYDIHSRSSLGVLHKIVLERCWMWLYIFHVVYKYNVCRYMGPRLIGFRMFERSVFVGVWCLWHCPAKLQHEGFYWAKGSIG